MLVGEKKQHNFVHKTWCRSGAVCAPKLGNLSQTKGGALETRVFDGGNMSEFGGEGEAQLWRRRE